MSDKTIRYTGEILNCVKHGHGNYEYPGYEFFRYEGSWENGEKHGRDGIFRVSNHSTYEGEFQSGEITGIGKKVWEDGRVYEGEWLYGEMHGKGIWTSADARIVYEGEFRDNKRDGHGYLKLSSGDTYKGSFCQHKYHGQGEYLRENGFFVSATFDRGIINGKCHVNWHKLASFSGFCENGYFHGSGHFLANDGCFEYDGAFVLGVPLAAVRGVDLSLDRSACSQESDGKKDKKKKPTGKKGAVEVEALGAVAAGGALGRLEVRLRYELLDSAATLNHAESTTSAEQPVGDAPLGDVESIPNPSELRRLMRLRLRPYIPPPPPAKGAVPEPPNPDGEMGDPVPLWSRPLTMEERSTAWERFPPKSLRFVNGVNPLTGACLSVCLQCMCAAP